jgi:hypothetical protein
MAGLIAAVCLLAACSAASHDGHATASRDRRASAPARAHDASSTWLLTRAALAELTAYPAIRDKLEGSEVYEILNPGQQPLAGVSAKPVVTFASATALEQAVSGGELPSATSAVLYDPEAWSFTPVAEQQDPLQAATRAAAAAHAHGLQLIVAPALNLTQVLAPNGSQQRWRRFLDLDLAGRLADIADIVELQAQSLERDTATYTAFVRAATSQAHTSNPGITVLAGLSTNPPGAPVGSQHLMAAIQATQSMVNGYWLNIPGQGPRCPTCNVRRPDIAVNVLRSLP